jgi:hypothetical protein
MGGVSPTPSSFSLVSLISLLILFCLGRGSWPLGVGFD